MISNNSNKIKLRSIEIEDLSKIQEWRNSKFIQPFVREYRELTMANVKGWYDSLIGNRKFEFFIIQDKDSRDIGVTGLTYIDWVNRHADLHLGLYEETWGCKEWGIPTMEVMLNFGFQHLNLNKIYAEIYGIDTEKLDLFNGYGFKVDASLREHYYHEGKYVTSHILSLLKSEYKNKLNELQK